MITNGGIAPSEYIAVLDRNTYSAVFQDGSIIYMECSFEGRTLIDHRYLFIPCPFDDSIVSQRPNHILLAGNYSGRVNSSSFNHLNELVRWCL